MNKSLTKKEYEVYIENIKKELQNTNDKYLEKLLHLVEKEYKQKYINTR